MSAITPQTELRLLKCPIESDNRNQITFSNATAQYNYFNSLPKLEVDNFTYQRKDSVIRYPAHIDSILTYNYVMYQNEAYTNKWFYAFITNMEYVNDNMTLITIKTDVYQSWQFSMVWKRSFVEREHVNSDNLGEHTVPEGLEMGAPKVYSHLTDSYNDEYSIVTQSTVSPVFNSDHSDVTLQPVGRIHIYNDVPTPGVFCRWDTNMLENPLGDLATFLNKLDSSAKKDALVSMFIAPKWILGTAQIGDDPEVNPSNTVPSQTMGISRISSLDGYVPKNRKLLTYPYCYIALSNGIGQFSTYKQERWSLSNNEMKVTMRGVITPGCSIRCYPQNYNGDGVNADESITLGKFPVLGWNSDVYTNWLTQNGVNLAIKDVGAIAGIVGGAGLLLTGGGAVAGASMIGGGIGMITNTLEEKYRHSLVPPTVEGSANSGDVTSAVKGIRLHAYRMGITQEYAKIIDNYFNIYGYKINETKIPNITGRTNWNYVKTIGANIEGDIPENDLNELKQIFNNGVTLWHKTNYYLDYSQSNNIA